MIDGGKDKYANLLTLIKYKLPKLYNIISDLCLEGTFKNQKYTNTFLWPNDKLVAKFSKMVEDDQDIKAIDAIRSLLLRGHHGVSDFKAGAKIGTNQFGEHILEHPDKVGKLLKAHNGNAVLGKTKVKRGSDDEAVVTVILNYDGDDAPSTVEGKAGGINGGFVPVGATISGGVVGKHAEKVKELAQQALAEGYAAALNNFNKLVSACLVVLKDKNDGSFKHAKAFLSNHSVLSWFFLTLPGCSKSIVKEADLDEVEKMWRTISDFSIIEEAKNVDYTYPNDIHAKIQPARVESVDKATVCDHIKMSYGKFWPLLRQAGALGTLGDSDHDKALKCRMDELRFMHEASVDCEAALKDAVQDLGVIENYANPQKMICYTDKQIMSSIAKEALVSGPLSFVKSVYFLYLPLTSETEGKLGGLMERYEGGDPTNSRVLAYYGGAAKKKLKSKSVQMNLSTLVKMLNGEQRKALKEML